MNNRWIVDCYIFVPNSNYSPSSNDQNPKDIMISGIVYFVLPVVISIGIIRKYQERKWGKFTSSASLTGKVFIVTGANSGIGKATTCGLVRRNAKVIMACRDINSAKKAIADIRRETSNGEMVKSTLLLS